MAQIFYIRQNSINPTLRMELVKDGKYDFFKAETFNAAIQNADITFSMIDENGILQVAKQPCHILLDEDGTCEERYVIEYTWKERDTRRKGLFDGSFEINFKDDLKGIDDYPKGKFIMPIYEKLQIMVL